jgi:MFS family permease
MLAVTTAVYGRVSDLVGVRLPLLVGVGLMVAGALGGALAPTFGVLLVARIFQGAGAAAVPTLGVAIISAKYHGTVRSAALGRVAGVAAAVSCVGPLAGGSVEGLLGWRAVIALPMLGALPTAAVPGWTCSARSSSRVRLPEWCCWSSRRRPDP